MRKFFDQSEETLTSYPVAAAPVSAPARAWVVFSGQSEWPWLKLLRPGFRHCFIVVNDGTRWMSLDPLLQHTEIKVHDVAPDFDLPAWLATRGNKVVPAALDRSHKKPAPVMLFTCVEAVKRVMGLHAPLVFTPWQLYCHLTAETQGKRGQQDRHSVPFNFQGVPAWAA